MSRAEKTFGVACIVLGVLAGYGAITDPRGMAQIGVLLGLPVLIGCLVTALLVWAGEGL